MRFIGLPELLFLLGVGAFLIPLIPFWKIFLQAWLSPCHGLDNAGAVPEPHYVVLPRFRGMAGPARVGETAQAGLKNDVN